MPSEKIQKRQTAVIISNNLLLSGTYRVQEGWEPNYVELPDSTKVSRVNIMGTVIGVQEDKRTFVLDDGTGAIEARYFDEDNIFPVEVGEQVNIIARPRIFGQQIYLHPEIVRRVSSGWLRYRKKELELLERNKEKKADNKEENGNKDKNSENNKESIMKDKEENSEYKENTVKEEEREEDKISKEEDSHAEGLVDEETPKEIFFRIIKNMDNGEGALIEDVLSEFSRENKKEDGNNIMREMLKRGDIFEIKGKLKVLE